MMVASPPTIPPTAPAMVVRIASTPLSDCHRLGPADASILQQASSGRVAELRHPAPELPSEQSAAGPNVTAAPKPSRGVNAAAQPPLSPSPAAP